MKVCYDILIFSVGIKLEKIEKEALSWLKISILDPACVGENKALQKKP